MRVLVPLFGGVVLAALSACGTSTQCTVATCRSGCCDVMGVCRQPGTATCGTSGQQCVECALGLVCTLGQCVPFSGGVGGGSVAGGSAAGGSAAGGSAAGGSAAGGSAAGGSAGGSSAGGSAAGGSAGGSSAGGSAAGGSAAGGSAAGGSAGGGPAGGSAAGGSAGGGSAGGGSAGGGSDGGADAGALDGGWPWPDGGVRVRIVAANLTSGMLQSYDPGHGQRILQALAPDIVAIQEFNFGDNSDASIALFVDATFDAGFHFHRGTGRIPNGVISRWPFVDAGEWNDSRTTDREFTWAVIDAPGPIDVWVVSLHLLSNTSANRNAQAGELVQYVSANVPGGAHLVLAGDLNTDGRGEAALGTLDASVVVTGPWPTDGTLPDGGNGFTSTNRNRAYDWVLASPSLHAMETPVVLGSQYFPSGLVFDTRVFTPLPPPALVGDSIAPNMQHMAVVRDFVFLP
ncbi:MAG: endonuclease/exonuclease/phosphatase family protein [Myxococcaceae bacterium]|nr:endonuclease/exonuclease/phosphatase family protein [Myxococcaceae bacterium]